jgi:acetyltransferase-like isoleucine patch superfamily enzyme
MAWGWFWMLLAGRILPAWLGMRIAAWWAPPYNRRGRLALWNPRGFISPSAVLDHRELRLGAHVFLDDRVLIVQETDGGPVTLGDHVYLLRDVIIQTGQGGSVTIGEGTHIQPRCQFSAYKGSIRIGAGAHIAPNCAFYPYDHGTAAGKLIGKQPLQTRGGIVVEEDAWLGFGVIVLDGVRVGRGAVVGAGAVVTRDIPDGAIAMGVPARVVRMRDGSCSSDGGKG